MFQKGDMVVFGRPNGEKTVGKVIRANRKSLTIEQMEARGSRRAYQRGQKWRVHPSLVQHLDKSKDSPAQESVPARSEAEILKLIRDIEWRLEPEVLYCDGERPAAQARRIAVKLRRQRQHLVNELGREPTLQEIWGG